MPILLPLKPIEMSSVFSHIIQKRFSQVNEDVATDALAYILQESETARNGFLKLLRGIEPQLPDLKFVTQQTEANIRPDMWGMSGSSARVFVENKFWAGLTSNQPVNYLRMLSQNQQPTVLLVNAPEARRSTIWRELQHRLREEGIGFNLSDDADNNAYAAKTELGPIISVTSWTRILAVLELEAANEASTLSDISQLRALCEEADSSAFVPLTPEDTSDQRIPLMVLGVAAIVGDAVQIGVTQGYLDLAGLRLTASWDGIGRYFRFSDTNSSGVWIGLHFSFWKQFGLTPVWIQFYAKDESFSDSARSNLESWATRHGYHTVQQGGDFAVGLPFPVGVERDTAARTLANILREIGSIFTQS